jgi:argininosuccinate lyase
VLKGLSLAYAKDLQEDKEPLFDAADSIELCLAAMTGMVSDWHVNREAMLARAEAGHPTATDLADWIVRVLGKPFRAAHHIAGTIVKRAEELGLPLEKLPLEEMQEAERGITDEVYSVLSVAASVNSRQSLGGTAPVRVREQISYWREQLK